MSEQPNNPINPLILGDRVKKLDFQTPLSIKPGETHVVVFSDARMGGEPEEVRAVLERIDKWKQLKEQYGSCSLEELKREYQRINSDFMLSMKEEARLQAIRGILVENHGFDAQKMAEWDK